MKIIEGCDVAPRGVPSRRDGATRPRPGRRRRAQPARRLRAPHRLGTGGPARAPRRTRHQLHRDLRRPPRDRHEATSAPLPPDQPHRRLRRRRPAAARSASCARCSSARRSRQGTGRRRSDGRRRDEPHLVPRVRVAGQHVGAARDEPASTPARTSTRCTRRRTAGTCPSVRSSRSSTRSSSTASASRTTRNSQAQHDQSRWPAAQGAHRRDLQDEDAGRMDRDLRRTRRVHLSGAVAAGSAVASVQRRAQDARQGRVRRRAAGTGAALLTNAGCGHRARPGGRWTHPRGPA